MGKDIWKLMSLVDLVNPKKSLKGKSAKIGNEFQKEINDVCKIYESMKVAYIQYFTPQVIYINDKFHPGKKFPIFVKKTGFDFIGGVVNPRNAIFIECKSTKENGIPVFQETTGIKTHQIEIMQWLESCGFLCLFLWKLRTAFVVYKFTPSQLLSAVGNKKQLTIIDAEENRFPKVIKTKYLGQEYYDFLGVL